MPQSKRWSKVEVRQTVTYSKLSKQEFAEAIVDLMVESLVPENPDPQSNGYNWGLAHAEMIFNGADLDAIKGLRDWLKTE